MPKVTLEQRTLLLKAQFLVNINSTEKLLKSNSWAFLLATMRPECWKGMGKVNGLDDEARAVAGAQRMEDFYRQL